MREKLTSDKKQAQNDTTQKPRLSETPPFLSTLRHDLVQNLLDQLLQLRSPILLPDSFDSISNSRIFRTQSHLDDGCFELSRSDFSPGINERSARGRGNGTRGGGGGVEEGTGHLEWMRGGRDIGQGESGGCSRR